MLGFVNKAEMVAKVVTFVNLSFSRHSIFFDLRWRDIPADLKYQQDISKILL